MTLTFLAGRCSERFADNGAACLYATYLTGANFWVLPHDFVVRVKEQQQTLLSSTEVSGTEIINDEPIAPQTLTYRCICK
jgi:hypothetical protein